MIAQPRPQRLKSQTFSKNIPLTPTTHWAGSLVFLNFFTTIMFLNSLLVSLLHVFLSSTSLVRAQGQLTAAEDIATQYSLTTSTSIPFPTATLSSTDAAN